MFIGNVSKGGKGKEEDQTRNVFRNVASLHRIGRFRGRGGMDETERDGIGGFFFLKLKTKNSLLVCVFWRKVMGRGMRSLVSWGCAVRGYRVLHWEGLVS